ncbi:MULTISPECIES: hypothetical protein [Streptomyces]|uniref:hypothetical protein n=1 Tax=Streptomyces TaxID=1883 RepID=UPI0004CBDC2F|nr:MULTISPECIES: hypothetical protein [unclassified Streptomyces]KPC79205.1 hypothetical protein ADK82_27710 [Streptomyces sp. NRRL S-4]
MADRTSHTPLCSISWTDVVQGAQHSSFGVDQEVELRFGLELDRSFWSSFETSQFFTQFCVYRFGELVKRFDHSGDTRQLLPGAPETQIWLGVALGRAGQASGERSGLVQFRPQIFFLRQGSAAYLDPEFAVAPHDHAFMVDSFSPVGGGFDRESLTGGVGIPGGTPAPDD